MTDAIQAPKEVMDEKDSIASGVLEKDRVVIYEEADANRIFNKGHFGGLEGGKLYLSLEEALFLIDNKKVEVRDIKNKKISRLGFMKVASKEEKRFATRYAVYRDIRQRGYITKTALKYGADFRVYERGQKPGDEHAKWVLFAVRETESFDWRKFAAMMRVAHSVKKALLVGIVDDECDVTYYTINWIRP